MRGGPGRAANPFFQGFRVVQASTSRGTIRPAYTCLTNPRLTCRVAWHTMARYVHTMRGVQTTVGRYRAPAAPATRQPADSRMLAQRGATIAAALFPCHPRPARLRW